MTLQTDLAVIVGECIANQTGAQRMIDQYGHPEAWSYLNQFVGDLIPKLERLVSKAGAQTQVIESLKEILDCPSHIDNATVPNAGIDAAPEQVVYNFSIGYLRIKRAKEAIDTLTDEAALTGK
jgi:hypothetical protein